MTYTVLKSVVLLHEMDENKKFINQLAVSLIDNDKRLQSISQNFLYQKFNKFIEPCTLYRGSPFLLYVKTKLIFSDSEKHTCCLNFLYIENPPFLQ